MATTIETHRQRLTQLSIGELRLEYEKVCGELTTSRHAKHIIKRILWQMQANLYGGLSEESLKRAKELADPTQLRMTAPKAKPISDNAQTVTRTLPATITATQSELVAGTQLERMYRGQKIVATIVENGVRWNGELYNSLSAVAKAVTGNHWNGRLFFGLTKKKGKS